MSKIKWIIGVDASLRNLGLSVFDNTATKVLHANLTTRNGMTDHDSVDKLVEEFFDLLRPYLEKVDGVSVTRIYFELIYAAGGIGKQGKGTARAEVAGVIKWNLREDGHQLFGVEPNALNSFFGARYGFKYPGRATKVIKQTTMDMLHRHCNFYTRNDNEADAYVAGLYGCAHTFEKQRLSPTALSRMI